MLPPIFSLSVLSSTIRSHAIREVLLSIVGTFKQGKRSKHPNAQASFNRRPEGKVYPFSSEQQDSRQRLQLARQVAKARSLAHQDLEPFLRLWINSQPIDVVQTTTKEKS